MIVVTPIMHYMDMLSIYMIIWHQSRPLCSPAAFSSGSPADAVRVTIQPLTNTAALLRRHIHRVRPSPHTRPTLRAHSARNVQLPEEQPNGSAAAAHAATRSAAARLQSVQHGAQPEVRRGRQFAGNAAHQGGDQTEGEHNGIPKQDTQPVERLSPQIAEPRVYVAKDGTEVSDEDYFATLAPQTLLVIAAQDELVATGENISTRLR